jgi:hypothetical protein
LERPSFLGFDVLFTVSNDEERGQVDAEVLCYQVGHVDSCQIEADGEDRTFFFVQDLEPMRLISRFSAEPRD